jgi:hypothetical protein
MNSSSSSSVRKFISSQEEVGDFACLYVIVTEFDVSSACRKGI